MSVERAIIALAEVFLLTHTEWQDYKGAVVHRQVYFSRTSKVVVRQKETAEAVVDRFTCPMARFPMWM